MKGTASRKRTLIARVLCVAWAACCLVAGLGVSVVVAWWATRCSWPENSPVPICKRAWRVGEGWVGVELAYDYKWWVPVERSQAKEREGLIVLRAGDDPEWPAEAGPKVRFTKYDTYSVYVEPHDANRGRPEWLEEGAAAFRLGDAKGGYREAAGWPCICLEGFVIESGSGDPKFCIWYWWNTKEHDFGDFPLRPIWPGLAVNAVVWGALLWCGVAGARRGWGLVVERLHRKPGLCEACGYDRRGLEAGALCPECGRHV